MKDLKNEKYKVSNPQNYLALGNEAMRVGDANKAICLYKQALKQLPQLSSIIDFNINIASMRINKIEGEIQFSAQDTEFPLQDGADKAKKSLSDSCESGRLTCSGSETQRKKSKAMLRLDSVSARFANGWAIDKENPNNPIVMMATINNIPYAITETHLPRSDVQKAHGGDGFSGFRAELSPYASYNKDNSVSIELLSHTEADGEVSKATKKIQPILKGVHYKCIDTVAASVVNKYLWDNNCKGEAVSSISIVILNLNGAGVLGDCIQSILRFNAHAEIIVVDHNSSDDSVAMLKGFNFERIKVIQRDKNYSYSESNNLGAANASGDVLIFMNNDIILTSDSVTAMANVVKESEFGLVGIKLWDLPRSNAFKLDNELKVTQHIGVHFNGLNRLETLEAFEVRNSAFLNSDAGILETPAVTAAMVGITKADFINVNGFNPRYFYGQEDVDFCLRFSKIIGKKIGTLLDHGAYHIRGLSRKSLSQTNTTYISNNRKIIQEELGASFRSDFRRGVFTRAGYWNQKPLSIAMVVSEISMETDKADFFTAKELGDAFESRDGVVVGYFDVSSDYDVIGYDVVIVFIDGFDPRKLKNVSPHCIVVGWARNWFDRWCERVWIEHYDMIYASSVLAQKYMSEKLSRHVGLLRIAASNECLDNLTPKPEFQSDYVFTGSYFESPREITDALQPDNVPYSFKLFGHNWGKLPHFGKYSCGPVSYSDIPSVYASTRLVVDDANIATKKWGALNCRIYDSLAAGVLCITNNDIGVREIFQEDFPVYNVDNLNQKLIDILSDDGKLKSLALKYQAVIKAQHTYFNRCDQLLSDFAEHVCKDKVSIKISAPDYERGVTWGDYHFAAAIRKELERIGYSVRIDCMDQWYKERSLDDNINLVLRGLDRFKPRLDQTNLLWIISHPDLVCEAELRDYDHVFVASDFYADKLSIFTGMSNIGVLHQASKFSIEALDPKILSDIPSHDILFIGNSRKEYREMVRWCIEASLPIAVYGSGWEEFIPAKYIHGVYVQNDLIPYYYKKAKVVLNDHWQDMKRNGFVSNRVFDVLAVGGCVVSDDVRDASSLFHDRVFFCDTKEKLVGVILNVLNDGNSIYKIPNGIDFACRVQEIDFVVKGLHGERK